MIFRFFHRALALFVSHWRGELPVAFTILVTVIGLRILFSMAFVADSMTIVALFIAVSVLILVWQLVGLSRCAERHIKQTGDMMMYWASYLAMLVAVVLTGLQALDLLAGSPPKITVESLRTRPLPKVSEDGQTVTLLGDINYALNSGLETILKQQPLIKRVELHSEGGMIYAARVLARLIERYQLNTHVSAECNSACTIVFMGGVERTLGSGAKLGFHQYKFKKNHPLQAEKAVTEQEKDRQYFARRGVGTVFLEQVYQSSHESIWWPDRQTLISAGVITSH